MFYSFHIKNLKAKLIIVLLLISTLFLGIFASISFKNYYPLEHMDIINACSEEYNLSPAFICAVIHTESKFDENAVSNKGASGLMQLTEPTAVWLAENLAKKDPSFEDFTYEDIFDPETNIKLGCYYLSRLLENYEYDYKCALAAYNAGGGNVNKWLENPEYSKDGKTLDYIPFEETENFVKRVEFSTDVYNFLLSHQ